MPDPEKEIAPDFAGRLLPSGQALEFCPFAGNSMRPGGFEPPTRGLEDRSIEAHPLF